MGRNRIELTGAQIERAKTLAAAGHSGAAIAAQLGLKGSTAGRRLREILGPRRLRVTGAKTAPSQLAGQLGSSESEIDPEADSSEGELDSILADLSAMAETAKTEKNPALHATIIRLRLAAVSLHARLNPPPPPPADQSPDMIAAAETFRTRLHEALQRSSDIRASWPVCGACTQHITPVGWTVEQSPIQGLVHWCLSEVSP